MESMTQLKCAVQFICDKKTNDIFSHFFLCSIRFSDCQFPKVLIKESIIHVLSPKVLIKESIIHVLRKIKNKKGLRDVMSKYLAFYIEHGGLRSD